MGKCACVHMDSLMHHPFTFSKGITTEKRVLRLVASIKITKRAELLTGTIKESETGRRQRSMVGKRDKSRWCLVAK